MIRNAVVAPVAILLRAVVRAILALAPAALAWAPAGTRLALTGAAGAFLETASEYLLYLLGWLGWTLDWIVRGPALWYVRWGLARRARPGYAPRDASPAGMLTARVTLLLPREASVEAALQRLSAMLDGAGRLLRTHGIALAVDRVAIRAIPPGLTPPDCGVGALFSRFFSWASARGGVSPRLTIYVVPDFGRLAGCSFPGADWIVVDLDTDGTTVVHEIGHLADLWRHHVHPDNFMTDRGGGSHDQISAAQLALLRTCRFVGKAPRLRTPAPEATEPTKG